MALSSLFPFSDRAHALHAELERFVAERVLPGEAAYDAHLEQPGQRWTIPPVMEALKIEAQQRGLWNLFLPDPVHGAGLSVLDYAPLAELSGHSLIAPEAINCNAPDTATWKCCTTTARSRSNTAGCNRCSRDARARRSQ